LIPQQSLPTLTEALVAMAAIRQMLVACALLLASTEGLVSSSTSARYARDMAEAQGSPVAKVVALIKDMLKDLKKEAANDEDVYNKMACWCDTNDKEKTKSVAEAEERIEQLTTKIEEGTANSARLNTEIKNLEKEIAANTDALDKATALRRQQLAEFTAEEKDLLQSISSLKSAITVLSKHNGGSLVQVGTTLQRSLDHKALQGVLTRSDRRKAAAFIQLGSKGPQSGEIFGIMNQMRESFETNLAASQKEESENLKAYEDLKAAKEEEIAAGQSQLDAKTQELATTDENLAQNRQDLDDTKKSLAADTEFLAVLKEKCEMADSEYAERSKTRTEEMAATSKALEILNSDESQQMFSKTFSFIEEQEGTKMMMQRRLSTSKLLSQLAQKFNSPHLSALAVRARLDSFTRVKKAIDDMVAQLVAENADEIKHKDFCVDEFNTNAQQTQTKEGEKKDLAAKIADLTAKIEELTNAINTLKSEVAEMQVQLKHGGEDRELANKEFQTAIAEQRATQQILQKALEVLKGFYKGAALLQGQQPAGFESYKKNEKSGGVMGMIQTIIDDAKKMETEAIRGEEDAQKAYEDFVKETNNSIETKNKDIANKSEVKAQAETDLTEAKTTMEATELELTQLANMNAELHKSCDFVLANFDARQSARTAEIEALRQAKAILSGSGGKGGGAK